MEREFTLLYKKYKNNIFSYLFYLSSNKSIAEELSQDVFLKVYLNINKFQGKSSFKTWIYRIAKNTYIDYVRKDSKYETTWLDEVEELHSPLPNPEEKILQDCQKENILEILSQLKEKYRNLIILRDMQNFTYQEISDITGLSLSNVKVGIYRARKQFQEKYKRLERKNNEV